MSQKPSNFILLCSVLLSLSDRTKNPEGKGLEGSGREGGGFRRLTPHLCEGSAPLLPAWNPLDLKCQPSSPSPPVPTSLLSCVTLLSSHYTVDLFGDHLCLISPTHEAKPFAMRYLVVSPQNTWHGTW